MSVINAQILTYVANENLHQNHHHTITTKTKTKIETSRKRLPTAKKLKAIVAYWKVALPTAYRLSDADFLTFSPPCIPLRVCICVQGRLKVKRLAVIGRCKCVNKTDANDSKGGKEKRTSKQANKTIQEQNWRAGWSALPKFGNSKFVVNLCYRTLFTSQALLGNFLQFKAFGKPAGLSLLKLAHLT